MDENKMGLSETQCSMTFSFCIGLHLLDFIGLGWASNRDISDCCSSSSKCSKL